MNGGIPTHTVTAEQLANVEGPLQGPGDWILNVCSISRPAESWWTRGGDITATRLDQPGQTVRLFSTSVDGRVGIPAAIAFGPDEYLYVADEGWRAVLRVAPDGAVEEFLTAWSGARLNGPNDLSFDRAGNLYFTDPWTSSPENPIGAVYAYGWESGELERIDSEMWFPNGIVVDGGRLYVAETFRRCVWIYDVESPLRVRGKRLFAELPTLPVEEIHGPDGMALDDQGNLYVAHYGAGAVFVFDRDGREVERIQTPGSRPTNVCFGGDGHSHLFVTVDDTGMLLDYPLGVAGRRLPFCPSAVAHHQWNAALSSAPGAP